MELSGFASEIGDTGPVTISGLATRGGPVTGVRGVVAPSGIDWVQPDEMVVCCGAGTGVAELDGVLAEHGQRVALPPRGTVGGALAAGHSGVRRLGDGPVRNTLLQARYVSAAGEVVKAGGPTVKNVSGFDLCRLLVGSRGTLGFLGEVILRTHPLPEWSKWYAVDAIEPFTVFAALFRPVAVLWDGARVWALLEGHPTDVEGQAANAGMEMVEGPPELPDGRTSIPASSIGTLRGRFVAEVGVGVVHGDAPPSEVPDDAVVALTRRIKHEFDPVGRLNPGVDVLAAHQVARC